MKKCYLISWARTGEIYDGKGFTNDSEWFQIYSDEITAMKEVERMSDLFMGNPIGLVPAYITPRENNEPKTIKPTPHPHLLNK